jgi:IS5 family transposase
MRVLVPQVTQAANDKQQVVPMVEKLQALPAGLNRPDQLVADAGYFSAANVDACAAAGIAPLMAVKRDEHHPPVSEGCDEPPALPANPTPVQRMTHRLKTGAGKAAYALRKSTVEPVFGIIKAVMGVRQFLTRGLDNVQGEWTLVCLAWNLKRMAVWRPQ